MARTDKRYAIYPTPKAVEVVGPTCPALNQAIECWAALLARATADNSREFVQAEFREVRLVMTGQLWQMNEWSLLAEALKGLRFDPDFANPGQLLSTTVEDAHRLEYIGASCLDWGECDATVIKEPDIDAEVKRVVDKLAKLDYMHAWAIIVAVQFFWEPHDERLDMKNHKWWTLAFRRQWHQKHSESKGSAATLNRKSDKKRSTKQTRAKRNA